MRLMVSSLYLLAAALAATPALAQQVDPLRAPECKAALLALSAEEDALLAQRPLAGGKPGAPLAHLLVLRKAAARACLGEDDVAPAIRAPRLQPPESAPSLVRPAAPAAMAPRPSPPPAGARPAPLLTVTGCDALGCWASDGTRLQQQGPNLLGPRGYCTRLGSVLSCP